MFAHDGPGRADVDTALADGSAKQMSNVFEAACSELQHGHRVECGRIW